MSNTTRDAFIKVIRTHLKNGATRAVSLAKSAYQYIKVLVDPTQSRIGFRLVEKSFKQHPFLSLMLGAAGAFLVIPIADALFGTVTSWYSALAVGAFGYAGAAWLFTIFSVVGPKVAIPAFHAIKVSARVVTDAITFVFSLTTSVLTVLFISAASAVVLIGTALTYGVALLHKLVWGVSLVLQTPGLVLDRVSVKTWKSYFTSWSPKQFVHTNPAKEATDHTAIVMKLPVGKNRPTARQTKHHKTLGPVNQMGTA